MKLAIGLGSIDNAPAPQCNALGCSLPSEWIVAVTSDATETEEAMSETQPLCALHAYAIGSGTLFILTQDDDA